MKEALNVNAYYIDFFGGKMGFKTPLETFTMIMLRREQYNYYKPITNISQLQNFLEERQPERENRG